MAQFYSAKRRVTTRQKITVVVNDLDAFGQGVARHNGKALFVQGALPGEQVEVEISEDKRQYSRGSVKRILAASPQRVQPRCPHYSRCGGCQQQHVPVELQQQSKASALAHMLSKESGSPVAVDDIISGQAWGYRRRARLSLNYQVKTQTLQMGFREQASSDLVSITQCPILKPELNALIQPLHLLLSGLQAVRRLGHVELVLADNGPLLVLRHLDALSAADRQKLEQFSHKHQLSLFLAPDSDTLEQLNGEMPVIHSGSLGLTFSPRDFIQVNDEVNQQMVARALAWLDLQPHDRVLDLFCGMGNFTLPMGNLAENVVGVEGVAALVAKAAYNAALNNLNNVAFYQHNLEEDVTSQPWAGEGFNKVLLDPARAGAAGVMEHIVKLAPELVVYVSCNPTTLARDSQVLLKSGYQLERVTMLDMFPHTGHLESMVLFSRK
ncbi:MULTISPECIES: 23S rRNA (uracil(1939)-C(5))-methyltransferase RlmD [Erwiniaceae]|uniref:23S rRNA (uracil(1939)-C(5))-methyltransferase RlmD n=1 Tax=Pantoea coffeiphila TaxID=1465635 RepID=A0A2S9I8Z8_9GAMM|nr:MULTISPECIES: 23S rRNA (uracil(1939)-C(5))-methyltransferase RlmD [Erwiniaceae]MCW1873849.1 23S rRNA (uracil(1939)-C(5))-methyltransferase RlmD [Erwinia sp. INIA01]PRD14268.1 23S rRNA (uracil(1939)-C(5))-methyltransferase RlmD [Pantoea coffeiphila]